MLQQCSEQFIVVNGIGKMNAEPAVLHEMPSGRRFRTFACAIHVSNFFGGALRPFLYDVGGLGDLSVCMVENSSANACQSVSLK